MHVWYNLLRKIENQYEIRKNICEFDFIDSLISFNAFAGCRIMRGTVRKKSIWIIKM